MGIRPMQCRSCFEGVTFQVNFRFRRFEEGESLLDGSGITNVNVMLYQWGHWRDQQYWIRRHLSFLEGGYVSNGGGWA